MVKRENKKGLEMAFSTIVVMVLAILLLIFLGFMLTKSGAEFRDKIGLYFSQSNADSFITGCNNLQATNSEYDYCCVNKTVKLGQAKAVAETCSQASGESWGKAINKMDCPGIC